MVLVSAVDFCSEGVAMNGKLYACICALGVLLVAVGGASGARTGPTGYELARMKLDHHSGDQAAVAATASAASSGVVANNFELLGHHDLGLADTNGDVWVQGDFAYVGTWADPCNGRGVKIVDVSDLRNPQLVGTLAAREGTSAEDMVARRVSTAAFTGDLMGVGIQRCGDDPALDSQSFGLELWDVTDPTAPAKLGEIGLTNGGGGVHELDLFQRGDNVYALVATPFSEWFDPVPAGDFRIIDVTDPSNPVQVSDWGAGANGFSRGPFDGQGSFGATFGHSARASADGTKAYVSYWDIGVLTFDISDVTNPVLLSRTMFKPTVDGDAHSMTPYKAGGREFVFQNDEDFDPREPATISFRGGRGLGNESAGGTPLWLQRGHELEARVVSAANEGCDVSDYPADTAGKIAVVRTPFPFFDPGGGPDPLCLQQEQEAAAEAAGAKAVVHDFISEATSPQWFDFGSVGIPVLFTDHATAQGMVAAGRAELEAGRPSWGYLRIFNARTGRQVAKFDDAPNVHALPGPEGFWSIHNTEVVGNRAYSSWYSNGVIALNLRRVGRDEADDPRMVGQFVPEAAPHAGGPAVPDVWGVVIRPSDNVIFLSDLGSGLWIVKATGRAAPGDDD
jgi:hypothetical protein